MLARVRATVGRVATVAGSAVLTAGLATDSLTGPGVVAAVTTAGVGLAANIRILRAPGSVKAVAVTVYAIPHAGSALVLIGERLAPDSGVSLLVQASVVALWTGATWFLRPGNLARALVEEAVLQEIAEANKEDAKPAAEVAVPAPPADESPAARWWREEIAIKDGIAPDTVLLEHQRVSENCVAVIIGAQRGMPVPDISKDRLSAHLDLPADLIEIGPVPKRGAGIRLLVIGPRPKAAESDTTVGREEEVWAEIAATAMPGVELLEANTYESREELTRP